MHKPLTCSSWLGIPWSSKPWSVRMVACNWVPVYLPKGGTLTTGRAASSSFVKKGWPTRKDQMTPQFSPELIQWIRELICHHLTQRGVSVEQRGWLADMVVHPDFATAQLLHLVYLTTAHKFGRFVTPSYLYFWRGTCSLLLGFNGTVCMRKTYLVPLLFYIIS